MTSMLNCDNCCGGGFLCTHEGRTLLWDDCPINREIDCMDCKFCKVCDKCNGLGLVEGE
jgi:hypothetical protein